jgi:hypothetical protein
MNDLKNINELIKFIDSRIGFYNRSLREVNEKTLSASIDKAYFYGNMSSLLDIRDTMTKLSNNIANPYLFSQDEYELTGHSSQNQF